jgi:hypothetical protein
MSWRDALKSIKSPSEAPARHRVDESFRGRLMSRFNTHSFTGSGESSGQSIGSAYVAPSSLPSVLSTDSPTEEPISSDGEGSLQGFILRRFDKSEAKFNLQRDFQGERPDTGEGARMITGHIWINVRWKKEYVSQIIQLHWKDPSLTVVYPHEDRAVHMVVIVIRIPLAPGERSYAQVTASRAIGSVNYHLKSSYDIPETDTLVESHNHTFGDKVRRINRATADSWFNKLNEVVPNWMTDAIVLQQKDRINELLRGYLSRAWE